MPVRLPDLPGVLSRAELATTVASIAADQRPDGAIPWYSGGKFDPWDHIESAMALDVGGLHDAAAAAYLWSARTQRADGSWPAQLVARTVTQPWGETNHAAYLAVGCWHHWLATGDRELLVRLWPTVCAALGFVLRLQDERGVVWWASGVDGKPDRVALLTGCSSVYHGLRCGLAMADLLGEPQPDWELAAGALRHALLHDEELFADRERYSMDWYYPILGGALRGPDARARLDRDRDKFVVPDLGVRCVSDHPWVTGAETCELALALDAVGARDEAIEQVAAMQHLRHDDGSYWTGLVYADGKRWPVERPTWTAAAVVLAADALAGTGPQAGIFRATQLPTGVDLCGECGRSPEASARVR